MRSLDGMEFFADAHALCVDGRVRRLGDLGLYHVPGATKETHCLRSTWERFCPGYNPQFRYGSTVSVYVNVQFKI